MKKDERPLVSEEFYNRIKTLQAELALGTITEVQYEEKMEHLPIKNADDSRAQSEMRILMIKRKFDRYQKGEKE